MPTQRPNTKPTPAETKANEPKATLATGILKAQQAFQGYIPVVVTAANEANTASESAKAVAEAGTNKRVVLISDFADIAIAENLSDAHIAEGVKLAIEAHMVGKNVKLAPPSITQFRAELVRGTSVKARHTIRADFTHAYALWAEEKAAENEAKEAGAELPAMPLRDAFKRAYHMVVGSTGIAAARNGACGDAGEVLADNPLDLAEHVITERGIDPKAAARAVAKAIAEIERINETFPDRRFETVVGYLNGINVKALQDAYAKVHGKPVTASKPKADKPAKASKPATTPKADVTAEEALAATDDITGEPVL